MTLKQILVKHLPALLIGIVIVCLDAVALAYLPPGFNTLPVSFFSGVGAFHVGRKIADALGLVKRPKPAQTIADIIDAGIDLTITKKEKDQ